MSAELLGQQRHNEQHPFNSVPTNPSAQEGFFDEHKRLVEGLEIEDVRQSIKVIRGKAGPAFVDQYDMSNGFYYEVVTALPDHPHTTIPVDMTTAWGTSAKVKSHNGRSLGVFVEAGFPGRLFGPPKVRLPKNPIARYAHIPEAFAHASNVSMDSDIAAYALISNHLDRIHKHIVSPGVSIRYGESRGIMEGLGATAVDELYGRKTIWLEGVDPCVPDELHVPDLFGNPKTVGEIFASIKTFRHLLTEARRLKYIDTVDPSLEYLIPGIMTYKTLFSGRAGDFAQNISPDNLGHINFFDSSVANGYESFEQKLKHAKETQTQLLKGGHLTLVEREMVYRSLARMIEVRDEFARHDDTTHNYDLDKIRGAKPEHEPKIKLSRPIAA